VVVVVRVVIWKDSVSGALRAIAIVVVTEAGCQIPGKAAGSEMETTVQLLASVGRHGLERHSRMCPGCPRCYHSRWNRRSLFQEDLPLAGHLSMLAA
jgi:hypothetical protein